MAPTSSCHQPSLIAWNPRAREIGIWSYDVSEPKVNFSFDGSWFLSFSGPSGASPGPSLWVRSPRTFSWSTLNLPITMHLLSMSVVPSKQSASCLPQTPMCFQHTLRLSRGSILFVDWTSEWIVALWLSCMTSQSPHWRPGLWPGSLVFRTLWKKVLLYVDGDLAPGRGHLSPNTRGPKNFCQPGVMTMVTRIPVLFF